MTIGMVDVASLAERLTDEPIVTMTNSSVSPIPISANGIVGFISFLGIQPNVEAERRGWLARMPAPQAE